MKRMAVIGVPGGWSSERLADALERRTGFRLLVDMGELRLDLTTGRCLARDMDLMKLDGLIVKKISPAYSPESIDRMEILRFLSGRGLPIFSKPERIVGLIDRLSCTVSLRLAGIPMPPTAVTESPEEALNVVREFGPSVFKPLFTSKARGMTVIRPDDSPLERITAFKEAGNPVMYIQQLVTHPGRDLGVTYLGGKYLATYARRGAAESWNTTTRSGGKYVPSEPTPEILEIADAAQRVFDLDFTSVDVVETPDGPKVFEVSAFGGFRGLLEANDIDAAELYADFALARVGHAAEPSTSAKG